MRKFHGKYTWWHENGQKMNYVKYKDGKRDGEYTVWYESGKIRVEAIFKDGKREARNIWNR